MRWRSLCLQVIADLYQKQEARPLNAGVRAGILERGPRLFFYSRGTCAIGAAVAEWPFGKHMEDPIEEIHITKRTLFPLSGCPETQSGVWPLTHECTFR